MTNKFFSFSRFATPNRRIRGKETAMKKLSTLAALVAVIFTTAATPAAATATPETSKAEPSASSTAYFPVASWPEYVRLLKMATSWYYLEAQKKWAEITVKESAEQTLGTDAGKVDILLEQIIEVLEGVGKTTPSDTKAEFESWMEANDCKYLGDKQITAGDATFTVGVYSAGCEPLWKSLKAEFEKRKTSAEAGDHLDNAVHTMSVAEAKYAGTHRIAMAHKAMTILLLALPESERPWPLTDAALASILETFLDRKQACIVKEDGSQVCGTIDKVGLSGLTLDGQLIPGNDIRKLCFDTEDECKDSMGFKPAWHSKHPVSLEGRFVLRRGWADQYDSAGMTGGLVVAHLHLHENLALLGGIGALSLTGQPTLGTDRADSGTLFAAMLGARGLLGSRNWLVAPFIEGNATFQGLRPGVEGVLGVQTAEGLRQKFPVDLALGISMGYYPTGTQPFTHPYKPTEDFKLFGVGAVLTAGYTF